MHKVQDCLRQKGQQAIGFGALAAAVLALDQLSKSWALDRLAPGPPKSVVAIPGFLRFEYAQNPGVAFSLFQNHPAILTGVALLLATVLLVWALFFLPREERVTRLALALIFGGAVGNLIDRFRHGFVVDFIVAHWKEHAWPTFNVADSAICVGIAVFFLTSILAGRRAREEETPVAPASGKAAS